MSTRARQRLDTPTVFFAALCVLLPLIVIGELGPTIAGVELRLRYKEAVRGLALAWVVFQLAPYGRQVLPYRPGRADLPLALFAGAVVASVLLNGAHWGTVRTFLGAVGLGLLGRALFAAPQRRSWFIHFLGATIVLIVARELLAAPDLLPPTQPGRYRLLTANPNVLGFLFAMATPLLVAEALARRGRRRLIVLPYVAIALLGALLTYSRSAAIGLAVGALTLALCGRHRGRALLVGGVVIVLLLAALRPDAWIAERALGDRHRLRIMHTSLSLAADAPVLGIGFGIKNLERRFPERYASLYEPIPSRSRRRKIAASSRLAPGSPKPSRASSASIQSIPRLHGRTAPTAGAKDAARFFRYHSANQLVDLLVGTGLVGTALALWWWIRLGRAVAAARRGRVGAAHRRAAGNLATFAAITVMSMTEPPLYHGKLLPFLFLILGYIELDPLAEAGERDLNPE